MLHSLFLLFSIFIFSAFVVFCFFRTNLASWVRLFFNQQFPHLFSWLPQNFREKKILFSSYFFLILKCILLFNWGKLVDGVMIWDFNPLRIWEYKKYSCRFVPCLRCFNIIYMKSYFMRLWLQKLIHKAKPKQDE